MRLMGYFILLRCIQRISEGLHRHQRHQRPWVLVVVCLLLSEKLLSWNLGQEIAATCCRYLDEYIAIGSLISLGLCDVVQRSAFICGNKIGQPLDNMGKVGRHWMTHHPSMWAFSSLEESVLIQTRARKISPTREHQRQNSLGSGKWRCQEAQERGWPSAIVRSTLMQLTDLRHHS